MHQQEFWYNYRTDEYDQRDAPETDKQALGYLPQQPAVKNIYLCYRDLGEDILHAIVKTLSHYIGDAPVLTDGDGSEAPDADR